MTVPFSGPFHSQQVIYEAIERAGYTDLWSSEARGADGLTPLAMGATWTPTMRLGTAILPAFTRGPALIAQSAAGLASLAPGRFVLGIGSSSNVIVEQWNGIEFNKPYQRTRDLVRFLKKALAGEKVSESYETFSVDGYRLGLVPEEPVPILVAALREGMLRMAGREADGAILNWLSADNARFVSEIVREENPQAEIAARLFVAPTSDTESARTTARFTAAGYLNVPVYRAFHEWMGRGDALGEHWEQWEAGDRRGSLAKIPDRVIDEIVIHGSYEDCRARVQQYIEAGVDTPVLAVLPIPGIDMGEAIEGLAPVG